MTKFVHPVNQMVYNTIKIESSSASSNSIGTGYFFGFCNVENFFKPCIVTNKHVVEDGMEGMLTFHLKNKKREVITGKHHTIRISDFSQQWIYHPDPKIDLAILPLSSIIQNLERRDIYIYYIHLKPEHIVSEATLNELTALEKIIMVGYPIGLADDVNNFPLLRTGVTSTHPKIAYNGDPDFLIDCASYPGSSGSPIFLGHIGAYLNKQGALTSGTRVVLLGTLYATPEYSLQGIKIKKIPTNLATFKVESVPTNLGVVIQAEKLLEFELILKNKPSNHVIEFESI